MKLLGIMRWLTLAIYMQAFGYSLAQTPPAQPSSTLFTLELSTPTREVREGSEEIVIIRLTNIWNHPLAYGVGGPGGPNAEFHFRITTEQGTAVKETAFGMKMHGTDPHSVPYVGGMGAAFIAIGETQTRTINLGKEYDLAAPGKYRVTVSRLDGLTHTQVTSNAIEFTVTPK